MIFRMYVIIHYYLSIAWLNFCLWLEHIISPVKNVSRYVHKIVVLGDGFAQGIGNTPLYPGQLTGICQMKDLIRKNTKIHHQWQVINCGRSFATSKDWLQDLAGFITDKRYKDAEIYVVILGSYDSRNKPPIDVRETFSNICQIVDGLRKKGKVVTLASIPVAATTEEKFATTINTLINEYCLSTSYDEFPVIHGPHLDAANYQKLNALCYDGIHFNANAYRVIAKEMLDLLEKSIISIEWETWKENLERIEYDPSLYD